MYHIENEIVGYVGGKAIVRDENGRWFFVVMPEELVTPGEQVMMEDLTSLEILPVEEREYILKEMEEV